MTKKKIEASGTAAPAARTGARRRAAGTSASPSTAANGDTRSDPTHDEIAEAAYRRYLSRGGEHGRDFDDWVEAERDLRQRNSQ